MNLGQAVALCCYELARASGGACAERERPKAPAELQDLIFARFLAMLETSGYVQARTRRSHMLKLRRLVGRLELSAEDAQVLLGMLRQIEWKLNQGAYRGSTSPPSRDSAGSSRSKRTA
jgi:tRNA/rRNA methyltransferase